MPKNSTRNRHTGRSNAFKRRVIKTGRKIHSRDGRTYFEGPRIPGGDRPLYESTVVRVQ